MMPDAPQRLAARLLPGVDTPVAPPTPKFALRKRNRLVFALIAGFLGPMLILSWYIFNLQRDSMEKAFHLEIEQMTRVFAQSMSEPIWNLIPDNGKPAMASILKDERVVTVVVTSVAQGEILASQDETRRHGETIIFSTPVMREGGLIGSVRFEVDVTHFRERLYDQWRITILILAVQVVLGLAVAVLVIRVFRRLEQQEAVEKANQRLRREVKERREVERALIIAKTNAEDASQAKTRFLASMSHELRTPLNAVIGFSDIIYNQRMGDIGDPRYLEYARDINNAGSHLLHIIGDILDIARLEGGNAKITGEDMDIDDFLGSCVRLIGPASEKKKQSVVVRYAGNLPALRADRRFLKQIVLNLLSNSVKFTPARGQIEVLAVVDDDNRIAILVSDNGIGMTGSEIDTALAPFGQNDADHTVTHDGVGLGLPIAKALTELHGGIFDVQSARGEGTTIAVIFPATRTVDEVKPQAAAGR